MANLLKLAFEAGKRLIDGSDLNLMVNAINTVGLATDPVSTALNTVGNGTILAAAIIGGYTVRGGSQSATPFTDTTDTAAKIIAVRWPTNAVIGNAFTWKYANNTNATATITGGTGVTVSGITAIPPGYVVNYLITYTAANTLTIVAQNVEQVGTSFQGITMADGANIVLGSGTGTQIGTSATTQKLGFFAATPVVQPTSANEAAVATTGAATGAIYGFTTAAQANGIVTLVNQLRSDLVSLGIIKGS